jgi:hypothetical protein
VSHQVFTAVVDLGQIDEDEVKVLNREIQLSLYDILDDHEIDYHTLTLRIIDGDKTVREYEEDKLAGFRGSDPDTSRKGALDVYPRASSYRHKALIAIAKSGDKGMTYEEVEHATGINSVWKRLSELRDGGWIYEAGERVVKGTGSQATIWKLTHRAERHIETKERAGVIL